jgi:hypothetical protein
MTGFHWIGEESRAALNTALQFLKGGEAIVIDIRRNGGGSPEAVQHLVSHFMEADRPLMTFHMNGRPSPDRPRRCASWRWSGWWAKPLYVLTSPASASAAEEFAGHVAGYRLASWSARRRRGGISQRAGAGGGRFRAERVGGRAVLASDRAGLGGGGIAPSIETPVPGALEVAHGHALRRLAAAAQGRGAGAAGSVGGGRAGAATPGTARTAARRLCGQFRRAAVIQRMAGLLPPWRAAAQRAGAAGRQRFVFEDDPVMRWSSRRRSRAASFDLGPAGAPPQGRYERTGG